MSSSPTPGPSRAPQAEAGAASEDASVSFSDTSEIELSGSMQSKSDSIKPALRFPSSENISEDDLRALLDSNDVDQMRTWIMKHYSLAAICVYLRDELMEILSQHKPRFMFGYKGEPEFLIAILKRIISELSDKWQKFDVNLEKLGTPIGSTLKASVEYSKRKISETVETLRREKAQLEEENEGLKMLVRSLEANYVALEQQARGTEAFDFATDDAPSQAKFLVDLYARLKKNEHLQSTLIDELQSSQNHTKELKKAIDEMESKLISLHQEKLDEVAKLTQEVELMQDEALVQALMAKINTLTSDPEACRRAVDDWLKAIKNTIAEKKKYTEDVKNEARFLDGEIGEQNFVIENLSDRVEELHYEAASLRQILDSKEEEYRNLADYRQEFDERANFPTHERSTRERASPIASTSTQRPVPTLHLEFMDHDFRYADSDSTGSPEYYRAGSPSYSPHRFPESHSLSLDSSQPTGIPSISVTAPSPVQFKSPQGPTFPDFPTGPIGPGTQTLPPPKSRLIHPGTTTVNPSTQTFTGVRNRFDVGQSLNMQTVHSGAPDPYNQLTHVDTTIPQAGPSRLADNPLQIKHTAQFTPRNFATPWISKYSRYGYTKAKVHPYMKVLNLPPGDYDMDTAARKELVLSSPNRDQPLLVKIDVEPQPLVETESGEHFICDISLNLQPAEKEDISPVYTYGVPPAVTPTTTRRHGLLKTPTGIFKKKHFNVRRVPGQYESPEEFFSPHHLQFEGRSPLSTPPRDPLHLTDLSLPWEDDGTSDAFPMNRTFEKTASPTMNRTFEVTPPPVMNRTFEKIPSPLIKGSPYRYKSHPLDRRIEDSPPLSMDTTFEQSPSPVIKGPSYRMRSSPLDRPFIASVPPAMNTTFEVSSPPAMDRTFERSPSPLIKGYSYRTFDTTPSPISERSVDRSLSPRLNEFFDRSPYSDKSLSPVIRRRMDRSPSPAMDRTFELSQSPVMDRTFERSRSPVMERTFDRSPSPAMGRTFEKTQSPVMNQTFERSRSPARDQTFERSRSPVMDRTFEKSRYPMDQTFERSRSPVMDRTFEKSMSPVINRKFEGMQSPTIQSSIYRSPWMNETFEGSPTSPIDRGFGLTSSPILDTTYDSHANYKPDTSYDSRNLGRNQTFDSHMHSRLQQHFNRSMSPRLNGTFERSMSPVSDGNLSRSPYGIPDRTFDSNSPDINRTYEKSNSPGYHVTFDESTGNMMNKTYDSMSSQGTSSDRSRTFDTSGSSG